MFVAPTWHAHGSETCVYILFVVDGAKDSKRHNETRLPAVDAVGQPGQAGWPTSSLFVVGLPLRVYQQTTHEKYLVMERKMCTTVGSFPQKHAVNATPTREDSVQNLERTTKQVVFDHVRYCRSPGHPCSDSCRTKLLEETFPSPLKQKAFIRSLALRLELTTRLLATQNT